MEKFSRDISTKLRFIAYLMEHPDERFWQAVRNFSGYAVVLGVDAEGQQEDTFYKETVVQ